MSILFADDFMGYGYDISLMLNGLYANDNYSAIGDDPDPNAIGSRVLRINRNVVNGERVRRVLPGVYQGAGCAFRLWLPSLPSSDGESLSVGFTNGTNVAQPEMMVTTTGAIAIRTGYSTSTIGMTPGPVLTANAWHHIEIKWLAGTTTGSIEVRVDGVTVLVLSNINSGQDYAQFSIHCSTSIGSATDWFYKDLVVWNTSGTHNNDFLGTVSVVGMIPNSDVSLGWTPKTGALGYPMIDNSPPDDANKYLTAPFPIPAPSTFNLTDLPVNVSSVRALITQVRARKADGGDGNIQSSLISDGSEVGGSNRPITTAFTYYEDVFETDPHTLASWTPAAADAVEYKINRTA